VWSKRGKYFVVIFIRFEFANSFILKCLHSSCCVFFLDIGELEIGEWVLGIGLERIGQREIAEVEKLVPFANW